MRLMLVQSSPRLGAVEANLAAVQSAVESATFDLLRLPELFTTRRKYLDNISIFI